MGLSRELTVGGIRPIKCMQRKGAIAALAATLFAVGGVHAAMVDISSTAGGDQYLSNQKINGSVMPWNLLSDALTRATGSAGDLVGHELLYSENGRLYRIIFDRLAGQIVVAAIHSLDNEVPMQDDIPLGDDIALLLTTSGGYLSIDIPSGSLGLGAGSGADENTASLDPIMPEILFTAIPEPTTLGLALVGGGLALMRRRR